MNPLGVIDCNACGLSAAERVTYEMSFADPKRIEQGQSISGRSSDGVPALRVIRLRMSSSRQSDHSKAVNQLWSEIIESMSGGTKAMEQYDRVARAAPIKHM